MLTIVDYGVGNIGSLLNMLDFIGIDAQVSNNAQTIESAEKLILPGVGAFDSAMQAIEEHRLIEPLNKAILVNKVPILGVCLGMQLVTRGSEEGVRHGLGWVKADVRRILVPNDSNLKVPHIGWEEVIPSRTSSLFDMQNKNERFYFVHSYHVVCESENDVLATVEYGDPLCCAFQHGNIYGVQFHPEKSHKYGMKLLKAFNEVVSEV